MISILHVVLALPVVAGLAVTVLLLLTPDTEFDRENSEPQALDLWHTIR